MQLFINIHNEQTRLSLRENFNQNQEITKEQKNSNKNTNTVRNYYLQLFLTL